MNEAKLFNLQSLMNIPPETTVFIETKQTLRPAFFMGVIDTVCLGEDRYSVHLITAAKVAKEWKWRLYNRTWRLWSERPTKDQRLSVIWKA